MHHFTQIKINSDKNKININITKSVQKNCYKIIGPTVKNTVFLNLVRYYSIISLKTSNTQFGTELICKGRIKDIAPFVPNGRL